MLIKRVQLNTCIAYHEASLPYTDLGTTCVDIIDGLVATAVKTDEAVNVETAGTYYLT
jgi:hypothetical protein